MLEWLRLAASIHVPAVKPYVYATMMQKKLKKTTEEQKKLRYTSEERGIETVPCQACR